MSVLDNLAQAVKNNTNVEKAAIQLIEGLAAALKDALATGDVAALQALADEINASAKALAAAIMANTLPSGGHTAVSGGTSSTAVSGAGGASSSVSGTSGPSSSVSGTHAPSSSVSGATSPSSGASVSGTSPSGTKVSR